MFNVLMNLVGRISKNKRRSQVSIHVRRSISVLPSFAMPYRNRSVEVVDRYFRASDEERRNMGGHDTLRRYWREWVNNWQVVARMIGVMADSARMAWQSLIKRFGSIALGQCELVNCYGQAFLRSYIVHVVNENDAFVQ